MDLSIRSRRVITPDGIRAATIFVDHGQIVEIGPADAATDAREQIDVGNLYVLPGLVDSHVHVNEPGRTEWEGFTTATKAAAAGGITTIVDMPLNCLPETTTVSALEAKRDAARTCCQVNYGFWGGVVSNNQAHIQALADAGVLGYKCFLIYPGIEGFTMVSQAELQAAMPIVAATGLPLLVHAELAGPIDSATAELDNNPETDWTKYATYLQSRPDEAELEAIALMISLVREYGCRVHIVHLSSARALPLLREARKEKLPITVETCPHYLYASAESIPDRATQFKCAPPIRSKQNQRELWMALVNGDIDLIASDHSPCPPEMKSFDSGSFRSAWGGIPSLSLALPVVWTRARERGIPLTDVVRWMSSRPAQLAGLGARKGRIEKGYDADLVVFDGDAVYPVTADILYYRHPVSPYMGEILEGKVRTTFIAGHKTFHDGVFSTVPPARECTRV